MPTITVKRLNYTATMDTVTYKVEITYDDRCVAITYWSPESGCLLDRPPCWTRAERVYQALENALCENYKELFWVSDVTK